MSPERKGEIALALLEAGDYTRHLVLDCFSPEALEELLCEAGISRKEFGEFCQEISKETILTQQERRTID